MEATGPTAAGLAPPVISVFLFSYGHINGPIVQTGVEGRSSKQLAYSIRHLPNPPRNLRANSNGLSRRLQKEFLNNDCVEAILGKVQNDIIDALRIEAESIQAAKAATRDCNSGNVFKPDNISDLEESPKNLHDASLILTVCCEKGRHRSVAFIDELGRRLADLKNGDGISHTWELCISVTHRDIGNSASAPVTHDKSRRKRMRCMRVEGSR
ncbi:hypothetical protein BGW36DRAFT_377439 [Talaromyces proteolyticus]|uniref:Uncharacterized protein n=1 Tax=Talaromyces proteolyticus TaxID=1131652 RepID=A0AAD4Q230_9EURO|nr:uncharacterized protein BGW36DRAFT_377439 [Talaromyces proteolyticus]KAH8699193.1 hypothetical protein BGW36DRAFT_377439 [Talaromyces proteolyticus]